MLFRSTSHGKRYAMANQTEGSGYDAPTRWVADVASTQEPHVHAVARARVLAAEALGYELKNSNIGVNYGLNMPTAQLIRAQEAPNKIAFVHGTSRQDKTWPLQHWQALGQRLLSQGYQVMLVHGNAAELLTSRAIAAQLGHHSVVLPLLSLAELTQELGACHGAIGVDSGVSHIAVALGLPHVQIYNFDTAWRTEPLGCAYQVSVFGQPSPTVDAVWRAWLACESAVT